MADFAVDGKTFKKMIKLKLKYQGKKSVIEGLRTTPCSSNTSEKLQ